MVKKNKMVKGFTLIELLIVVCVCALVMVTILPSMIKAIKSGNKQIYSSPITQHVSTNHSSQQNDFFEKVVTVDGHDYEHMTNCSHQSHFYWDGSRRP
jgi:Tfp pilus assembly protein PilE